MSSHRHKRSHSRESLTDSPSHKTKRSSSHKHDKLDTILASLAELKSDMSSCKSRINEMETKYSTSEALFAHQGSLEPLVNNEEDDDMLSILAGNEFGPLPEPDEVFTHERANKPSKSTSTSTDTAIKPPNTAIKPPNTAIEPPNTAIEPPNTAIEPSEPSTHNKSPASAYDRATPGQDGGVLFDPEGQANSWSPSPVFHSFLEKHFRKKLSYEQICDIIDEQAIPEVDALVSPTLDHSVINQIPPQHKKFVQERDKELSALQRAILNATGPLCCLHDRLETNQGPLDPAELKRTVEQTLCLLGSANTHLSTLRRKKVLASVNKAKIDLANQPLPNAKKWLFGEDFPSIASKEAELARGLAKNLGQPPGKQFPRHGDFKSNSPVTQSPYNKYLNNRGKNRFFRHRRGLPRQGFHNSTNTGKN